MANLSFSFNKIKRSFFNVELKDGQKLQVKMPTKGTFQKLQTLQEMQTDEDVSVNDVMDTMAGIMADVLNNNLNGVHISPTEIEDQYDLEEMTEFIGEYYEKFVGGLQNNPN